MIENSQQIIRELLHQQKFDEIITHIKSGKIDILNLYLDDKKQTMLHYTVTIQKVNLLLFLQKYCLSNYNSEEIQKWVNKLNADQFAAIHLASFSGNLQCLDILISLGANTNLRSGSGLLPIHAAAQGDQPFVIKYWMENGIDVNILDNIGNSSLHWAVYQGCDTSVNYLLSFGCQLNIQNQQHQTPLHIGVKYGQTRIVKKLLIRGADRLIQDNDNKIALQIAKESQLNFIANMLEDSSEIAIFCSISQSYHPTNRRISQIIGFLILYISTNIFINLITFEQCKIQFSISLILEILTLILYLLVVFINPGYVNSQIQLTPIMNVKGNPEQICPDCQVIRPPRSKHCEICKKCVIVYDHHCPWVNNCIGARNFAYFFNFLSIFLIQIIYVSYIIIYTLIESKHLLLLIYPIIIILIFIVPILYKFIQLQFIMVYIFKEHFGRNFNL